MKKGFLNFLFMASLSFALVFLILLNCSTEVIYEEPQTAPTTTTYAPTTSTSTSTTSTTTYASTTVGPSTTTTVAIVYYKVTYDGNNNTSGSVPTDSTDYEANDLVTTLANSGSLLKTGYIFGGWNTEADGTGTNYAAGTGTFNITGNTTLYAKWNSYSYTVTFDSDGGTPATTTKSVISPATTVGTLPANPAKGGFYFAGWFTEKSGSGTQFMANTIVTGNLTVYANWSSVVKYAVVFDV
ncbi:MAG TPA: InlB B-repeat-containing protein, partial [Spirochaetota bacterium]|nr:InlB B-repeat-containing protein [Spirochaetota bacterium]